ncbi:Testis specific basic protein [Apodemus speciosus]|uniref:Testis specific basic protein n=1 Tax=Apodemus speciosus TaxID=105296 RepID=A0ABQ0FNZ8_APOSI
MADLGPRDSSSPTILPITLFTPLSASALRDNNFIPIARTRDDTSSKCPSQRILDLSKETAAFREIVLAVILTVLALAILAILVARWTRRRHNEVPGFWTMRMVFPVGDSKEDEDPDARFHQIARPTGVSIGGKSVSHHSLVQDQQLFYRQESQSVTTPGTVQINPAVIQEPQTICQEAPSRTRSTKSLTEPLTGNAGDISGTIGPITGATGPIKLSQKTFLQTPGPIVQCMDSSADGSNAGIPVDICCCQQLSIKPSCQTVESCCPPEAPALPLLITQRASTKRGPPIILKKSGHPKPFGVARKGWADSSWELTLHPMDCKGQMMRHGGSVTFQDECGNPVPIKCCKEWRRCQCQYCCPKRCESHMVHQRREPIWCEEPAPSSSQQHPPRRQDSQVRLDQRNDSTLEAQTICYEEPFLFRRLESLIRRNQDGIVIKQNEGGFLIKKAEDRPSERRKKRKSSKKSEHQETDSDSSAPKNTEGPQESHEEKPEGEEKKHKKEKKKKKKKDKDG